VAERYAQRLRRLAVLNAPHPAVWLEAMRNNPVQRRKSSYVRLLQLPYLPEFLLRLRNYGAMAKGFRDSIRKEAFTEEDLNRYRTAWSQPGAISAMIDWYRALLKKPLSPAMHYRISCPTLLIWGCAMRMRKRSLPKKVPGCVSMAGSPTSINRRIGCSMMNLNESGASWWNS
jgi:epoxide hydrolase 4